MRSTTNERIGSLGGGYGDSRRSARMYRKGFLVVVDGAYPIIYRCLSILDTMKTSEESKEIARRMGAVDLYSSVFVFDAKHRPLLSRMYLMNSLTRIAIGPMSYLMRVIKIETSGNYLHIVTQPILSTCCKVPVHESLTESGPECVLGRCSECGKKEAILEYEAKT